MGLPPSSFGDDCSMSRCAVKSSSASAMWLRHLSDPVTDTHIPKDDGDSECSLSNAMTPP